MATSTASTFILLCYIIFLFPLISVFKVKFWAPISGLSALTHFILAGERPHTHSERPRCFSKVETQTFASLSFPLLLKLNICYLHLAPCQFLMPASGQLFPGSANQLSGSEHPSPPTFPAAFPPSNPTHNNGPWIGLPCAVTTHVKACLTSSLT